MSDPLDPLGIYDSAQVARLVHGKSVSWFYHHRRQLEAKGFPKPCSPIGHGRWDGAALIAWKQRPADLAPLPGGKVVDFSPILAARAAKIAGGTGARRRRGPSS